MGYPFAFFHRASVEAPCHFGEIAPDMLRRKVVVRSHDLTLEQSPYTFDAIGMDKEVTDILASDVVDAKVNVIVIQTVKYGVFIGILICSVRSASTERHLPCPFDFRSSSGTLRT
nr:hypothetical protein [Qipengyuania algicida]